MKRLVLLLAALGTCASLGVPAANAAGDANYTGTMAWEQPVTPVAGENAWTFNGTGAGTLSADDSQDANTSYAGPLSMVVRGESANESTLGGGDYVQLTSLNGTSNGKSVSLLQASNKIYFRRSLGSPIVVPVRVNVNYCTQFGCIVIYQCVQITITYSTWPYPSASASTSRC